MVGIDRPGGGVRLYASREIPDRELRWGLATNKYGDGTGWHIDAEMRRTLVTDGATWGEAFGRVFEIWENADRNEALELERKEAAARELSARAGQPTLLPGFGVPRIAGRVLPHPEDEGGEDA